MNGRKLYFETSRLADELPVLAKTPIDRTQLARYAGASGDFNPFHIDETYARAAGMPSVYAPGMLVMGFLGQLVSGWARGGQLRKYSVKFVKMCWPGDVVVCKGRIIEKMGDQGRYFLELEVRAENQKGELVLRGQASVQVFFNSEDESRQRSGMAALVVQVPHEKLYGTPANPELSTPEVGQRSVSDSQRQSARRVTSRT